jgi:hypothetical protein
MAGAGEMFDAVNGQNLVRGGRAADSEPRQSVTEDQNDTRNHEQG